MPSMTLHLLSLFIVSGLLLAAVLSDLRNRRIPNALVLYGMALGFCFQGLAPLDTGLLPGCAPGPLPALLGGLAGLGLFLPLYMLRVMGAGDVKLLAMTGIWLGPQAVLDATLWTLLAGGVLALGVALASGSLCQVGRNLKCIGTAAVTRLWPAGMSAQPTIEATGRLPYAVAIATGSTIAMVRLLWE